MENNKSPSSCISPAATSMSAGESSWAMHIANFLASPHGRDEDMDHEAGSDSSFSSGFSSSFDSIDDDASFITSELMCDDEEEDESLQDTACSSAAGPKMTSMENVDMKSKVTMDVKEFQMPQLAKYSIDVGSRQQATSVYQETINSCNINEKAIYECNELRKKGLCLVPISMLIDYLG
ncbi:hypothetical protein PR202_ga18957 [Eleusine coracana subsp. coracana]|uniref:Uncharacterized protein n=1 Tax=Eleusine coracana subsp. coracana TaxID=191504 RepID=A0AAV5CU48_ELECO|nr:hypothetical protein QOZ80_4AG0303140 [Eleusine coracana subsp. coracana]GJN01676.1 hypothetical protein PR202_ga18957 [Eleusine coracana subsp. coracana]